MKTLVKITSFAICLIIISCGSFGEGMLAAFSGYNPYGYGYGQAYGYGYGQATNTNYYSTVPTTSGTYSSYSGNSSSSSTSSTSSRTTSTSSRKQDCRSIKDNPKYTCGNTGKCGMCNGDGLMDGSFGQGPNSLRCTLCNGTGKCKYCK